MSELATEVVVDPALGSITHLDGDWEIACEVPARLGPGWQCCLTNTNRVGKAEWIAVRGNCCTLGPRYVLMCDWCRRMYLNYQRRDAALRCADCDAITGGPVAYLPLNTEV